MGRIIVRPLERGGFFTFQRKSISQEEVLLLSLPPWKASAKGHHEKQRPRHQASNVSKLWMKKKGGSK